MKRNSFCCVCVCIERVISGDEYSRHEVLVSLIFFLYFHIDRKNILVAYSSGYAAASLTATLTYAALSDIGLTTTTVLLLMLVGPLIQIVAFYFIKESNATDSIITDTSSTTSLIDGNGPTTASAPMTLAEKRQYLPKLMKFMIPLLINCFCEYIISQSVSWIWMEKNIDLRCIEFKPSFFFVQKFDLLYIPGIWLSHADQYRWLQVL